MYLQVLTMQCRNSGKEQAREGEIIVEWCFREGFAEGRRWLQAGGMGPTQDWVWVEESHVRPEDSRVQSQQWTRALGHS